MEKPVPKQIKSYPEARMFGRLPSYGLYCRHVSGLKFENVAIATARPDERPALHFQPLIRLVDVRDAAIT